MPKVVFITKNFMQSTVKDHCFFNGASDYPTSVYKLIVFWSSCLTLSSKLHSSGNWKDLEGTLSQDMSTLSAYLQTWRLKLSHTKTVTAAFHLNNRETKREIKVYSNSRLLPFCPTPTYLGVKLDRRSRFITT